MSKKIFVTYGNEPYYESLKRIKKEAEKSGEFDIILCYTDKDLPKEITKNELFKYKRGGGYWIWKPWVVLQALERAEEDDVVVYSDCGNTIYAHKGWKKLFRMMNKINGLFFYNGDKMERRTRRETFEHFGGGIGLTIR